MCVCERERERETWRFWSVTLRNDVKEHDGEARCVGAREREREHGERENGRERKSARALSVEGRNHHTTH